MHNYQYKRWWPKVLTSAAKLTLLCSTISLYQHAVNFKQSLSLNIFVFSKPERSINRISLSKLSEWVTLKRCARARFQAICWWLECTFWLFFLATSWVDCCRPVIIKMYFLNGLEIHRSLLEAVTRECKPNSSRRKGALNSVSFTVDSQNIV